MLATWAVKFCADLIPSFAVHKTNVFFRNNLVKLLKLRDNSTSQINNSVARHPAVHPDHCLIDCVFLFVDYGAEDAVMRGAALSESVSAPHGTCESAGGG